MTLQETNALIDGLEALGECIGDSPQNLINWLGAPFSRKQRNLLKSSIEKRNAFYSLPLEERLQRWGYKKNDAGNFEITVEL